MSARLCLGPLVAVVAFQLSVAAQLGPGTVKRILKVSDTQGGFTPPLHTNDQLGRSVAVLGDLDGNGVIDLASAANYDDDGGSNRGAVWLLRLKADGTVKQTTKISSTQGGFAGPLRANDEFGRAVAALGDLDGDGVTELAVGAPTDSTGGSRRGAVWILFLNQDGTVKRHVKIASGMGGFTGRLKNLDWWGFALASLGDFDGDGVVDLAVGAALDDDGAVNAGAAWLLYLRRDGTVKEHRKISKLSGGFTGILESPDQFGTSVTALGDLNGDGMTELAVGAVKDGDGGAERGAVYVLFLTANGTVAFHQKISSLLGGWPLRTLSNWDWLGSSLAPLGDLDGDGVPDVAIGARNDDDGGSNRGAFYLTFLNGTLAASPVLASGPSRGPGSAWESVAVESVDEDAQPRLAETVSFGHGPEPEGALELVDGDGVPGSDVTFWLRVPEAFAGRSARARLFFSALRGTDAAFAENTGILLDPRALVGAGTAVATPRHASVEITVRLPRKPPSESLVFQAVWKSGGQRELTDAVELALVR